jgi:hypothetical protein
VGFAICGRVVTASTSFPWNAGAGSQSVADDAGLHAPEVGVPPTLVEQVLVVTALDDLAVLHDEDLVGVLHGGAAVGDDDGGAVGGEVVEALLDAEFRLS